MHPQLSSHLAHSSAIDRRLNSLLRHIDTSIASSSISSMDSQISASPTSGFHGDSVFAHVVRAPEDPILGVLCLSVSVSIYCFLGWPFALMELFGWWSIVLSSSLATVLCSLSWPLCWSSCIRILVFLLSLWIDLRRYFFFFFLVYGSNFVESVHWFGLDPRLFSCQFADTLFFE